MVGLMVGVLVCSKENVTSGRASGFWSIFSVSQAFSTMAGAVSRWYPMNTSPTVSSCLFSSCLENQIENSFLPPSHSLLQPPLPQPTPLSLYVSFMQQYTCEACNLAVSYMSLTYEAFVVNLMHNLPLSCGVMYWHARCCFDEVCCPLLQLTGDLQLLRGHDVVHGQEVFFQTVDQWYGELVVHHVLLCYHDQPGSPFQQDKANKLM